MGSRARVAVAILSGVGALVAPLHRADAGVSASERKKLAKTFAQYVREADAGARDALWKDVEKVAAKLSCAEVEELVAAAVPGDGWDGGYTDELAFTSAGETWTYSAILPRKRPKGLVPLVLDVGHGSWKDSSAKEREDGMRNWLRVAGCEDDVVYVRTRVIDRLSTDGRYDTWTAPPRKPAGAPNLDTLGAIVLDAVRDASLRWPVDPDHVYVQGISQTGYWTWWLAQMAPDRWAAAAPVGAVTFHVRQRVPNVLHVPLFVLHGTEDPTCPFAQAKGMCDDVAKAGGDVDFRPTEGGKHMDGVFVRFGEIWPEMAKRARDPCPTRFERKIVGPARPGAYWLRAVGIAAGEFNPWGAPCRVAGEIDGQTLRVEASGCEQVVVLIRSTMLDVGAPVTIELNGKRAWKGRPDPAPRTALDVARERGDGTGFGASVTLTVE